MKWGEVDSEGEYHLTRENFINFYKNAAFNNIETTRSNIEKFGYSNDLRKMAENEDPDDIL